MLRIARVAVAVACLAAPIVVRAEILLSQSTSTTITPGNSAGCSAQDNNGVVIGTRENHYYRRFHLADFGVTEAFDVSSVDVGIETASGGADAIQPISIRLHDSTDFFSESTATLDTTVGDQSGIIVNFPISATIYSGDLIAEVFTPDGLGAHEIFMIGSNGAGQSAPSYVRAPACSVDQPTTTDSLGFPNMHIVLIVHGALSTKPTIAQVSPNTGPSTGGQSVTISGTNLAGAQVVIGGNAASVTQTTSTSVIFVTPAHETGHVDVTVIIAGVGSATAQGAYTYFLGAPTSVAATADTATSVVVSWPSVPSAVTYDVLRSADGTRFAVVDSTSATTLTDSTVSANTAYLYKVRAVDVDTNPGPDSAVDLATTVFDDPIVAGVSIVQAVHVQHLRTAVEAVRTLAGLGAGSYSTAVSSGSPISAADVDDLRSNLNDARGALSLPTLSYTDPTIASRSTLIKAAHITELRAALQ